MVIIEKAPIPDFLLHKNYSGVKYAEKSGEGDLIFL